MIVLEDWSSFGTDFTDDLDLPLLEGEDWDEYLGETHFLIFMSIMIFFFTYACFDIKSMRLQMLAQRDLLACRR